MVLLIIKVEYNLSSIFLVHQIHYKFAELLFHLSIFFLFFLKNSKNLSHLNKLIKIIKKLLKKVTNSAFVSFISFIFLSHLKMYIVSLSFVTDDRSNQEHIINHEVFETENDAKLYIVKKICEKEYYIRFCIDSLELEKILGDSDIVCYKNYIDDNGDFNEDYEYDGKFDEINHKIFNNLIFKKQIPYLPQTDRNYVDPFKWKISNI